MIGVACSGKKTNKQTNNEREKKEAPPSSFLRQVFFSLID